MGMLTIEVQITLESLLHLGAGQTAQATSSDSLPLVRNWRGQIGLPAATFKGIHRAAVERLAAEFGQRVCGAPYAERMCHPLASQPPCLICRLFGSRGVQGRLYYDDLTTTATPVTLERTRASLSRRRGLRTDASTNRYECLPTGAVLTGQIKHLIAQPAQVALVVIALRSLTQIGAGGSAGMGLCRVQARALDAVGQPIPDRQLGDALAELKAAR